MRPYDDWVRHTKERYFDALKLLNSDPSLEGRDDIEILAAACAVSYCIVSETNVHEQEVLKHMYQFHDKERPSRP